jgi:hypothetical protein
MIVEWNPQTVKRRWGQPLDAVLDTGVCIGGTIRRPRRPLRSQVAPTDCTIGQAGATVLTDELQMHDRHIAFPLIDDGLKFDLALVPTRLAPDHQPDVGLEIVGGGGEISHIR